MQLTTAYTWSKSHTTLLTVCAILIGTFILFAWLRQEPVFLDGDPFYHAKMAQLIIEKQNSIKEFPWIPGSILEQHFTDHHFLYHIFLVPFVLAIGDPLIAVRIASIFFASVFIAFFYLLLRSYTVQAPFAYALLLFLSPSFITRINLDKAPAISLVFLLVGLYSLAAKRRWLLVGISFLYVWLYDAWPILLIASFLWCCAHITAQQLAAQAYSVKQFFKYRNYSALAYCLAGITAGIIINPYFPNNLSFFKTHLFSIAIATKGLAFGIGQEWFPVDPFVFIRSNVFFSLFWLCALSWLIVQLVSRIKKLSLPDSAHTPSAYSHTALFFGSFSLLLFLATVKSQRMAEYFIPIGILFIACSLCDLIRAFSWADIKDAAASMRAKSLIASKVLGSMAALIAVANIMNVGIGEYEGFLRATQQAHRYPFYSMQKVGDYMRAHIPPGTIIAANDWSYFSQLMYYAPEQRYLWGLDPTFTYDVNPEKYDVLLSIMRGEKNDSAAKLLKNEFGAQYVVVAKQDKPFLSAFSIQAARNASFKKEYEDSEVFLYAIQ